MKLKKSIINIGGTVHTVVKLNFSNSTEELEPVTITSLGQSILFRSNSWSNLEKDKLEIHITSKCKTHIFLINSSSSDYQFLVNNNTIHTKNITNNLSANDIFNLLYSLSYEEYKKGNSFLAFKILSKSLMDKYLCRCVLNAFTPKEREKCALTLYFAMNNKKIKLEPNKIKNSRLLQGQLSTDEILEPSTCFMELLDIFEKNDDKYIPISSTEYRIIRKRIVDHYNMFKKDEDKKIYIDFKNLIYNKENLNISIRYIVPGKLTINPKQAKAVGLSTNIFDAHIFREQTLIKDGEFNISSFYILASNDTLNYLRGLKIQNLYKLIEDNEYILENYTPIEINTSLIPIINSKYCSTNDSLDFILDCTFNQRVAECKQKILKYYIEKSPNRNSNPCSKYTKEQISLLREYGLDEHGTYEGIDNKPSNNKSNNHQYRFFEFSIKGFSTLPKIDELLKKIANKKPLNYPETIMKSYINYLNENNLLGDYECLCRLLTEQKNIIYLNKKILSKTKFAKTLTGGWWEGLVIDSSDKYIYTKSDKTLVIKIYKKLVTN